MGDSVIIRSEDVFRFASALQSAIDDLRAKRNAINGGFSDLGGAWRDQKYQQFSRIFQESITDLDRFLKEADGYVSYLRRKAAAAQRAESFQY